MCSHNERQFSNERRFTHSEILTTTEAHQESQESSAAALPDDDKYFLINSSPSTQSIVSSIPSEPLQVADQTKPVNTTIRPLQYYHSSHLRYENKHFHTGSSVSLHPTVSRMISEPITKESLSASCSCTKHFQRPLSLKSLPAFMNDQHSNTSPPNDNCMTIHPRILLGHPMSRSVSQEYNRMPHTIRNGHGFHRTYVSQLNPSPAGHGMTRCAVMPEVVPQSSYSETDMPHVSMCNCQCPHCGKFRDALMAHDQHTRVTCIPVVYTHNSESLYQLQHPPNHLEEVPNMSSSVE